MRQLFIVGNDDERDRCEFRFNLFYVNSNTAIADLQPADAQQDDRHALAVLLRVAQFIYSGKRRYRSAKVAGSEALRQAFPVERATVDNHDGDMVFRFVVDLTGFH